MPKDIDHFLSRTKDWKGSERDLLDLAKECLPDTEYYLLEQAIEQGYEVKPEGSRSIFSLTYLAWCRTFNRTCNLVFRTKECDTVRIILWAGMGTLSQLWNLERLGWLGTDSDDPRHRIRLVLKRSESVEEDFRTALDILDLPFHRGLPLIKNRYERLMGESIL